MVAIHLPGDFDPSVVTEAMVGDIDVLKEEMDAAGVRLFAGGLSAASDARSLRAQPDSKVLVTKEHVKAVFGRWNARTWTRHWPWGRKAVVACRAPVEVRAFLRIRPGGPGL